MAKSEGIPQGYRSTILDAEHVPIKYSAKTLD